MIKLVGIKRFMAFLFLLTANALVAAGYFFSVDPMRQDAQMQLNAVSGQVSDLRGKITNVNQEAAFLKENLPKYQALQEKGFFLGQDRFMIERTLEDLRARAGALAFSFDISELEEIPNADAAAAEHKLVNSRIKLDKVVTWTDVDVYAILQNVVVAFPDHARLQSFDIRRTGEVTERALQDIAEGRPVSFVDANIAFDWMTLVPKNAAAQPAGTGSAGSAPPPTGGTPQ